MRIRRYGWLVIFVLAILPIRAHAVAPEVNEIKAQAAIRDSLGAVLGGVAPAGTRMFGKVLGAAARDSMLVTNANAFSAMFYGTGTTGPSFYFYGTGIGTASRDSLVGSILGANSTLNVTFSDLDSVKWVAPAAGSTVIGWVQSW
jgi:hypothetical protein